MSKHTPGEWTADFPWIVAPDPTGKYEDIYLAQVIDEDSEGRMADEEQQRANLHLMALTPKLLNSLNELVEICRVKCGPHDEVILPAGRTNHEALVEACNLIEQING